MNFDKLRDGRKKRLNLIKNEKEILEEKSKIIFINQNCIIIICIFNFLQKQIEKHIL